MKDRKKLYSCILLFFTIYTLLETTFGLLSVLVAITNINIYTVIVGEIMTYIIILYFVFFRLKSIPEFKLWVVFIIFILFFMPKNFFYVYTIDELREIAKITNIEKINKTIFKFIFSVFACIKYYRIKE
jgi:hypothetical protein